MDTDKHGCRQNFSLFANEIGGGPGQGGAPNHPFPMNTFARTGQLAPTENGRPE